MCGGNDYAEESVYEKQLVEMADRQLAHYNELYVPLEYQQMADVNRYRSDVFKQGSKDKSVNAARMNTPSSAVVASGMNPGAGGHMLRSMATEQQSGASGALGAMTGLQSAEDLYAQGSLNTAASGRQQQGLKLGMASTMAQQQAGVIAAQKAAQQTVKDAYWGAAGTIAGGAAAGYYGRKQESEKPKPFDPYETGVWQDLGTRY